MLHVALFEPEIAPNTGNIIRLCANTGARLHLIHPLGFTLDDRRLRRAGLDYHEWAALTEHEDFSSFSQTLSSSRIWGFTTKAELRFDSVRYQPGDVLLFGPETRGLPDDILARLGAKRLLRIPMRAGSRSLNLSNAVAVAVYQAWQQLGYAGID